jgi:Tol biopolymer transport system component
LSPDGRRAAVSVSESGSRDIWIIDLERKTKSRLTFSSTFETMPAWSPDGRSIVYRDIDENAIFLKSSDGTGDPVRLIEGSHPAITPDGRHLIFNTTVDSMKSDVGYAPLDGSDGPEYFVQSPGAETYAVPSPDGNYVLYRSDDSGAEEIYMTRYPKADGKWQVSTAGGTWPRWGPKGDRIYYLENGVMMEVSLEIDETVRLGTPQKLFALASTSLQTWGWRPFDISSDGERFLLVQGHSDQNEYGGIVVVKNWLQEFEDAR